MPYINDHLEHLEDAFLTADPETMYAARNVLAGQYASVTTKYDGRISVVTGLIPGTDKFFLASKGLFNKKPIYFTTLAEIKDYYKKGGSYGDIQAKMLLIFRYMKALYQSEPKMMIVQSDVLFTYDEVKMEAQHYYFQPNAVKYTVKPFYEPKFIKPSIVMALAPHTKYIARSMTEMRGEPITDPMDIPVANHKGIAFVWPNKLKANIPAEFKNLYDMALGELNTNIAQIGTKGFREAYNNRHIEIMRHFINVQIKTYGAHYYSYINVDELLNFINHKSTHPRKHRVDLSLIVESSPRTFQLMLKAHYYANELKLSMIGSIWKNTKHSYEPFLPTVNGVMGHEGYVVTSVEGIPFKLVDRIKFSYQNFRQHGEVANG